MRHLECSIVLLLAIGCAGTDPGPAPSQAAPEPPPPAAVEPTVPPRQDPPPPGGDACEQARVHYVELRARENHCTRDDDCAEIHPGVCSQGPHYVDVAADHAALEAAARAFTAACVIPACEMPMPLGIAHCEAGRCEAGRSSPRGDSKSCWDTRITYMEMNVPSIVSTYEHLQGITPLHAVGVPSPGTLRISAQLGCTGCELKVSEHNTGMARLAKGTPFTPEPKDPMAVGPMPSRSPPPLAKALHLEFPVTPGPYFIAIIGGDPDEAQLEVSLRDAGGKAMVPNRQGVVHQRICED